MGRKEKGLYLALHSIYEGSWKKQVLEFSRQLFWSAVLPVLLTTTTLAIIVQFYIWLRLRWFSSARELHHEALCAYQLQLKKKKSYRTATNRKVRKLLQRAIQRDPTYQPAYLSMAASYLYPPDYPSTERDPDRAMRILAQCRQNTQGGEEIIQALVLDCQAIQSGQEHMILDTIRQDEYLNRAFAKSPTKILSPKLVQKEKESKKEK